MSSSAGPSSKLIPASASAPTVPDRQWLRIVDVVSNPETQPNRLDQADRLNLGEARGETDERSLMIEREAASARSAVRVAMSKISQVPNIAQLISPREFSNAMLEGGGHWFIDKAKAWDEGENRLIMRGEKFTDRVHIAEEFRPFRCPASHHTVDSAGQGLSAYVAVAGLGADAAALPAGDRRAGLFGYERTTKVDQISDGTSTTMAVIEVSKRIGPWKAGGPATLRGLDPSRKPYLGKNGQFGGNHRGECMVLFADGAVRIVREKIDPSVLEALSTIAGGESVDPFWDR